MATTPPPDRPTAPPEIQRSDKSHLVSRLWIARQLNKLSIGWKLNLGFGLLVGLTVLVIVFNAIGGTRVTQYINRTGDLRVPSALASAHAQASLIKMVADIHGYLALSDLGQIADYYAARRSFEANLAELETLAQTSATPDSTRHLNELKTIFADWAMLSEKMFQLHNNPRLNQPGLHLYSGEVQPLSAAILVQTDSMIQLQEQREFSTENSALLKDMIDFRTSLDTMITNLYGFTVVRDFNFKAGYLYRLPSNTTAWENLRQKQAQLTAPQRSQFDAIDQARKQLLDWPAKIFDASEGEHAYEDLYLFQAQSVRQAEQMLSLLSQMTADQQTLLQSDLSTGRLELTSAQIQSLAGGLLALLLGIALAVIFRSIIAGSVRRLTGAAEQIAGGDLLAHAAVESGDEIGQLATTFNLMTDRLRDTIARLEKQTQQLEKLREAAEAASLAKSEFLANMSHELRTPLNGILGYAQILGRDEHLSPTQANAVDIIHASGEHLLTLINDLLDLSKIEARKMELQPADVHLPNFLEAIVGMFQIRAQQKKTITFTYEKVTRLPPVIHADEKRLRQILINLIGNAIKFTDQGEVIFQVGLIDSATSALSANPIEQLATTTTCQLRFAVIDTGVGIRADKLEHIFLPFEQVSDAQHRVEGTGLGLTITRNLVEAMNGQLVVESEVGRGSTFRLDLEFPATWMDDPHQSPNPDREIVGYIGPRCKLLVVDDKPSNRSILVNLLRPLGFELSEAGNGQQAVEQATAIQPDAIFLDLLMPVMDGLEAARQIRRLPELNPDRRVVLIAMSSHAFEKDVAQSTLAGYDAFLAKPVEVRKLLALLAAQLNLTWLYREPTNRVSAPVEPSDEHLTPPPPAEMAALLDLAMQGALPRLKQRALQIAQRGEQYQPFVQRLCQLVDEFDEEQLLALIEHYQQSPM